VRIEAENVKIKLVVAQLRHWNVELRKKFCETKFIWR